MEIHTLIVGPLSTNCYLIWQEDRNDCVVIDPGDDASDIFQAAGTRTIAAILLTHGHFDHVGAVRQVVMEAGCPVYLCDLEKTLPPQFTAGPLYLTDSYGEGDTVEAAGLVFHVLHTPGHTPGAVCLQCENVLFTGDTLFKNSWGRTDLPGGSPKAMAQSLARLGTLEEDHLVYPGHGRATTLFAEKEENPFM